jgi:hypothetical protein
LSRIIVVIKSNIKFQNLYLLNHVALGIAEYPTKEIPIIYTLFEKLVIAKASDKKNQTTINIDV